MNYEMLNLTKKTDQELIELRTTLKKEYDSACSIVGYVRAGKRFHRVRYEIFRRMKKEMCSEDSK